MTFVSSVRYHHQLPERKASSIPSGLLWLHTTGK